MRHSRVTAVWDDEPVPAVPAPPDQTPARPGHTVQPTTQARVHRTPLRMKSWIQAAPSVESMQGIFRIQRMLS